MWFIAGCVVAEMMEMRKRLAGGKARGTRGRAGGWLVGRVGRRERASSDKRQVL